MNKVLDKVNVQNLGLNFAYETYVSFLPILVLNIMNPSH
jgi:hypothetical protein